VTSFLADGQTVGIGMPLILSFEKPVPAADRPAIVDHLTVTTTPAQPGAWKWVTSTELHYRPKDFWSKGTSITYQANLKYLPVADGLYARSDLSVHVTVGRALTMKVDANSKQMTVTQDGKVIKTLPVSLGKPSTPSSSGTMLVMEKKEHTVFDTKDEDPVNGYRTDIDYAQRITWGGEFIHAASWSEGVQGKRNVSHGCVNVSEAMGKYLFGLTLPGDPVTVTGTARKLADGNGWTDWNETWAQFSAA
jgi:lipoprotein-anchoring transpeptidase ErfK/SrfK